MEASRPLEEQVPELSVVKPEPEKRSHAPVKVVVVQSGGWRKDAKWITGLLLLFLLMPTLFVATIFRLTSEGPAVNIIGAGLQGFFHYDQLIAEELPSIRASANAKPGVAVVPDLPVAVTISARDARTLSSEDLQKRIIAQTSLTIYRQGGALNTEGKLAEAAAGGLMGGGPLPLGLPGGGTPAEVLNTLPPNTPPELRKELERMLATGKIDPQNVPPEMRPMLEQALKGMPGAGGPGMPAGTPNSAAMPGTPQPNPSSPGEQPGGPGDMAAMLGDADRIVLSVVSADAHNLIGSILKILAVACLLLGALFVFFSRRWGRLGNLGTVLAYASFPGFLTLLTLQFLIDPANQAPTQRFLIELEAVLRSTVGVGFVGGILLSIVATVAGSVGFFLRRRVARAAKNISAI